jgi:signal transduction histidine kinase
MRAGTYEGRAPEAGAREIAELSGLINAAMAAIAEREHALKDAYARLKRAEQARETMTHMLVHDLKGPISNVSMLLDVLEDDAHPDDRALLTQGKKRCAALLEMIADLLLMARLEQETPALQRAFISLDTLFADACAEVQHIATQRGARIEVSASTDQIEVDVRLIRRALVNLMLNALKHGAPPVRVSGRVDAGVAILTVEDDGAGVPPELQATIFERFQQGEGVKGGAGLGLAFVRLAARAHGGDAQVEGARFTLTIPVESMENA